MEQNIIYGSNYGVVGSGSSHNTMIICNVDNGAEDVMAVLNELRNYEEIIPNTDVQEFNDCISVIEKEVQSITPRKSFLRSALDKMHCISKSVTNLALDERFQGLLLTVTTVVEAILKAR